MESSKKSSQINTVITDLTGNDRKENIEQNICVFCHKEGDITNFNENLSLREFSISRICQDCQYKVFS